MTTEAGQTSVTPIPMHSRDTPPHLDSDSGFELANIKISKALEEVGGPIFCILKDATIVNAKPEEIHDFFSPPHYSEHKIQLRTETAIEYGIDYLRRSEFEQTTRLARSDFKRPLLVDSVATAIAGVFANFTNKIGKITE